MLFYHIYKTTFKPTKQCYFGLRSSIEPNWGRDVPADYIGSPVALGALIKSHGIKAFELEVLFTSTDKEQAERYLRNILNPATLADPRCLNLEGMRRQNIANTLTGSRQTEEHKANRAEALKENQNALGNIGREITPEEAVKLAAGMKLAKEKIKWYNNGIEEKKIDIANNSVPEGWTLGKLHTLKRKKSPITSNS